MATKLFASPSFVLVNTDNDPDIAAALPSIMAALQESVGPGSAFAACWGDMNVKLRIATSPTDRLTTEYAINWRPSLPEAPGAAAYHYVVNGVPDIEIGKDAFESLTSGNDAASAGADHELKETLIDMGANGWKDTGAGQVVAEEVADPVQNTGYAASNGVMLSNFVLPSAFIPGSAGPWDYCGSVSSQDQIASPDPATGYAVVADSPQNQTQVGGAIPTTSSPVTPPANLLAEHVHGDGRRVRAVGGLSDRARKRKAHPWSRTYRRGVRGLYASTAPPATSSAPTSPTVPPPAPSKAP